MYLFYRGLAQVGNLLDIDQISSWLWIRTNANYPKTSIDYKWFAIKFSFTIWNKNTRNFDMYKHLL